VTDKAARGQRAAPGTLRVSGLHSGYRRVTVLHGVGFTLAPGTVLGISGPNGAGKSTLLKLMLGDLHPAWGGWVKHFEFTAKNTLWEVKRKIGFISPELQSNYREPLTGAEVIASGFFSSVGLVRRVSRAQRQRIEALVDELGLRELATRNVLQMSYGEFRRVLLARALAHKPELLICDEPFDGLDASARARLSCTLSDVASRGTIVVMVSYHRNDLPACITHVAELKSGAIVFRGPFAEFARRFIRAT